MGSSTAATKPAICTVLSQEPLKPGDPVLPVLLDGLLYSLQPDTATLQLVPSAVEGRAIGSIVRVGSDIYAIAGDRNSQVINVVTGDMVDLSQIPGELHWKGPGSGIGELVVVIAAEEFKFREGEGPLLQVVALDPASGAVEWTWTAFIGDPAQGVVEESRIVASVRSNPARDRILVHSYTAEGIGQAAVILDSEGEIVSDWPPPAPRSQPLVFTDNLSIPAYEGLNAGWFDTDFMLYDHWPNEPRLTVVDPIAGLARVLSVTAPSDVGFYLPVGNAEHLLHWDGRDLHLLSTFEPSAKTLLATGCTSVLTDQSSPVFRVVP